MKIINKLTVIQQIDFDEKIGSSKLYLSTNETGIIHNGGDGVFLKQGQWVGGGTIRNSLFTEQLKKYTNIDNVYLSVVGKGDFSILVYSVEEGSAPNLMGMYHFGESEMKEHILELCSLKDIKDKTRIFWHLECDGEACAIRNISFATDTTPINDDVSLSILIRTFGKTNDIISLTRYLDKRSKGNTEYSNFLKSCHFIVLDTSKEEDLLGYSDLGLENINLHVYTGPNLGGGGNASQNIKIFFDHYHNKEEADEILILDDDLKISIESFFRYYSFLKFKTKDVLVSCPVLKLSEPETMWECGAYWGRENPNESNDGEIKVPFPVLEKHLMNVREGAQIDSLCSTVTPDYVTFIFLGMSAKVLQVIGYPAAFFLRGDDVELSLRARSKGYQVIINPNIACWHEPGHSYAQEFMAILHGLIINLKYGVKDSRYIISFLEQRWIEHSAIHDYIGSELYVEIAETISRVDSDILAISFADFYKDLIKKYGSIEFLTKKEFEKIKLENSLADRTIANFLYPGVHGVKAAEKIQYLHNPGASTYYRKASKNEGEWKTLRSRKHKVIEYIHENFDEISENWTKKLELSYSTEFWTECLKNSSNPTTLKVNYESCANQLAIDHNVIGEPLDLIGRFEKHQRIEVLNRYKSYSSDENMSERVVNLFFDLLFLGTIPRDFKNSNYMKFNERDVKRLYMHPRLHYRIFAKLENRRYK